MKHSQHSTNCLRRGCLTSLVSSENLMCHRPWPIYFMPYSLSSSSQLSHLSTCCQKKKKTFGLISHSLISAFPLHCFFVFVFLLEFLICKREKMRSYHSLMCCPTSLCSGWRAIIRAQGGGHAMLCYAMLCMLNVVAIMKMQG